MSQTGAGVQAGRGVTAENIHNWFRPREPQPQQIKKYNAVLEVASELGNTILNNTPAGPDQTAAIRQLRECCSTCMNAILDGG